jgi:hypothetical protein
MQKPLDVSRLSVFFIAGKTLVASGLLFALTLPMTTCTFRRSVEEHRVELTTDNIGTILCFVWPIAFLLARVLSRRVRASLWPFVVECVLAVASWMALALQVSIAAVFSLGGITPAAGYKLASSSLAGYFALSLFEGALVVLDRWERRLPAPAGAGP